MVCKGALWAPFALGGSGIFTVFVPYWKREKWMDGHSSKVRGHIGLGKARRDRVPFCMPYPRAPSVTDNDTPEGVRRHRNV